MHVTLLVQAVVTSSWLLLSSARVKPTPCDGGRSEGSKWFDGCRWCVCGRLGQVCSSHRCSHLVSLVPVCPQVGSRWLDGCYYCQCLHHGIECTLEEVCAPLLRREHIPANLLSSQSCFGELGDRCVCGVDGIPSCTAEIIERLTNGAITIQLHPSLPVQSTLLSPQVAPTKKHFLRLPHNDRDVISRSKQPNYFVDPLNIHNKISRHEKQKRQPHTLVKRNLRRENRPSSKSYDSLDYDLSNLRKDHSTSHSKDLLNEILNLEPNIYQKSHEIRRHHKLNNLLNRISHKPSPNRRKLHARNDHTRLSVDWADHKESRSGSDGRHQMVHGLKRPVGAIQTWNDEVEAESNRAVFGEKWTGPDFYLKDQPAKSTPETKKPLSLLIVSDNLCRLGVRWYGGSLRCYCGRQYSITCGDPALVAPRVDGFRVEEGDCQEGQEWEDNYCSLCQCVMSGLVVCQRSPTCPLPFLIKPRPLSHSEDIRRQGAVTGEFSGLGISLDGCHPTDLDCSPINSSGSGSLKDDTNLDLQTPVIVSDLSSETTQPLDIDSRLESLSLTKQENRDKLGYSTMDYIDSRADQTSSVSSPITSSLDFSETSLTFKKPGQSPETEEEEIINSKRQASGNRRQCIPGSRFRRGCRDCTCNSNGTESCSTTRCPQPGVSSRGNSTTTSVTQGPDGRPMQRPPQEAYYNRTGPIDLSRPLVSCGNFTVGQTYYDECNTCQCLPDGPICTNMNCRL